MAVSEVDTLDKSLLATGFPYNWKIDPEKTMGLFNAFMSETHGVRRAGAAALDLAYIAAGRLEGFWETRLAPWDVSAGALLIEEAGGQVADFTGRPLNYNQRYIDITAAGHPRLLEKIVMLCQQKD